MALPALSDLPAVALVEPGSMANPYPVRRGQHLVLWSQKQLPMRIVARAIPHVGIHFTHSLSLAANFIRGKRQLSAKGRDLSGHRGILSDWNTIRRLEPRFRLCNSQKS